MHAEGAPALTPSRRTGREKPERTATTVALNAEELADGGF